MDAKTTELIPRTTATTMVENYEAACDEIERGYALLQKAEERLKTAFQDRPGFNVRRRNSYGVGPDETEAVVKEITRDAWRAVAALSEFKRILSTKRAKEFDTSLEEGKLPDLTVENMQGFARHFGEHANGYVHELVLEVFEMLRPAARSRGWGPDYKTNEKYGKFDIGKKVILSGMVTVRWAGGGVEPSHYREQQYRTLDNVFHLLDGKGAIKTYGGPLHDAVTEAGKTGGYGETDYFKFRACLNGNLHVEFKRLDLVKKLNAMAAEPRLKGVAE